MNRRERKAGAKNRREEQNNSSVLCENLSELCG